MPQYEREDKETPQSALKKMLTFEDQWLPKDRLAQKGNQLLKQINRTRDVNGEFSPEAVGKIERIIQVFEENIDKIYNSGEATELVNQDKMKLYNFEKVRALSFLPDEAIPALEDEIRKSKNDFNKMQDLQANIGLIMQYWQNQLRVINLKEIPTEQDRRREDKLKDKLVELQKLLFKNFPKESKQS
ncbi:MAG: hypothetical protein NTZ49_04465 [Candidatus Parcubacteria bacterium]|nr:hypothetical protein [Candidatus Parcubacteria bacterium]